MKLFPTLLAAGMCCCTAAASAPEIRCSVDKAVLAPGDKVRIKTNVKNNSGEPLKLGCPELQIFDLDGKRQGGAAAFPDQTAAPGEAKALPEAEFTVPESWRDRSYFIRLAFELDGKKQLSGDLNFIKIFPNPAERDAALTVYRIDRIEHKGVPVYALDGGMSAEFAVEKALAVLDTGISHSWITKKLGSGPRPVFATADFLKDSLESTVRYYDSLGADREYETVIIGSGVSSVPYLSRVLKAPVLPVHFLAGVSSMRELDTLLDITNNEQKIPSYAVVGYDFSVADFAVAWIKITSLPEVYVDFLKRHKTKQIVFMGTTGVIGETLSRKLSRGPGSLETDRIAPRDVFVLYTSCSNLGYWKKGDDINAVYASNNYSFDSGNLLKRMPDVERVPLDDYFRRINDWESGISKAQLDGIAADLKNRTPDVQEALLVTAVEDGEAVRHMYEFASYLALEFYSKNAALLAPDGAVVKGVVFNPYLTSHPYYESVAGLVPYLFWQGSHNPSSLADRYDRIVRREVGQYFSNVDPGKLEILFNLSRNFRLWRELDSLQSTFESRYPQGKIIVTDYSVDDIWDAGDGGVSSTEFMADDLAKIAGKRNLKELEAALQPLTLRDLRKIRRKFDRMDFQRIELK